MAPNDVAAIELRPQIQRCRNVSLLLQPRILVVDDDPAMRGMLASYLGENGLQVDAAADPGEMATLLEERSYALIVLDLSL